MTAYSHCRIRARIPTQTRIPVLCRNSDPDSDPLIEMYGIGMDICPRDGYLSLKWAQ